jgi:hypothetical protein
MRLLRRILTTIVVTLAVILACIYWVAPIALSFYAARKVPPVARITPTDLKDHSVSQASGMNVSCIGYGFEVPWNDLDESKTQLFPKDKPNKTMAILAFQSGLRLMVTYSNPRSFADQFGRDFKMPPQAFDAVFGPGAASSDYLFEKSVLEFTPDKMHYWSLSPAVHYREQTRLMIKSIMPVKAAESGIFNLQTGDHKGFQQGDPRMRPPMLDVELFAKDSGIGIFFALDKYRNPAGLSQPEINRIVQSLHRIPVAELAISTR